MAIISMGGFHWDPQSVGWGGNGPSKKSGKEMLGYSPKKRGPGKLSDLERERRTVNIWNCHAVYALFERGRCVYVGEGKLGNRLESHWKNDPLVGRWDSFTWLSPWMYFRKGASDASIRAKGDEYSERINPKKLVVLLQMVAIRLGSPEANSQIPKGESSILWLTQLRSSSSCSSQEEKMDEILKLVKPKIRQSS